MWNSIPNQADDSWESYQVKVLSIFAADGRFVLLFIPPPARPNLTQGHFIVGSTHSWRFVLYLREMIFRRIQIITT